MLILLPPSESKSPPDAGPRLDVKALSGSSLTRTRVAVLKALIDLCDGDLAHAGRVLGVSPRQVGEAVANRSLRRAPCAPASEIYSGVLFDALSLRTLPRAAAARAAERVRIASALFGLLTPTDEIPAYRLSAATALPGIGRLASAWKGPLSAEIARIGGDGIILDLRSNDYIALGPVPQDAAMRTAIGRVITVQRGRKVAVSHFNKWTKGLLCRELLRSAARPRSLDALATAAQRSGFTVDLVKPNRPGAPWTLEIVQRQP